MVGCDLINLGMWMFTLKEAWFLLGCIASKVYGCLVSAKHLCCVSIHYIQSPPVAQQLWSWGNWNNILEWSFWLPHTTGFWGCRFGSAQLHSQYAYFVLPTLCFLNIQALISIQIIYHPLFCLFCTYQSQAHSRPQMKKKWAYSSWYSHSALEIVVVCLA